MKLKEMIKVMEHYENGGVVEFKRTYEDDIKWEKLLPDPVWNWERNDYRIKETKQKVTIEKWLCLNLNKGYFIREAEPKHLLYDNKVKLIESYEVEL